MDLETVRFLTSEDGRRLLEKARDLRTLPVHRRAPTLRAEASADEVRSALVQDDLRRRALARCVHADRLLFTAEALEQATAWPVAEERARRWPGPEDAELTDLGAGIGLDALAAALTGRRVRAVECDPVRALLLAHNAQALGVSDLVRVETADVLEVAPSGALAFLDPGRRPGGRRTRDPEAFEPPRSRWGELLGRFDASLVKLSPAAAPPWLRAGTGSATAATDADAWEESGYPFEIVSLGGRARERRLFVGPGWSEVAPAPRRALALPSGRALAGEGLPWPAARAPQEGDWLLDPDPSVVLADLVGDLARAADLAPVHPRIAYLTGPAPSRGRPGHWVRVEACLSAHPRAVNAWLRAQGVGTLTVRSRGLADDAATFRRRLHPRGPAAGTVAFTRGPDDRWVALAGRDVPEEDLPLPMTGE